MYSMAEMLSIIDVSPATFFRWERLGYVKLSKKYDEKRERVFTEQDVQTLKDYKESK